MDKGTFETYILLCDKCANKIPNPMACKAYPERKPSAVLGGARKCDGFNALNLNYNYGQLDNPNT